MVPEGTYKLFVKRVPPGWSSVRSGKGVCTLAMVSRGWSGVSPGAPAIGTHDIISTVPVPVGVLPMRVSISRA